jgi:Ribbon-helix-helix protein, copG family
MRTTVTLDEDVAARLQQLATERRISFKEAINETLRAGLDGERRARDDHLPTYPMDVRPGIDLDRALRLDSALEDEETMRKLSLRK